MKSRSLTFRIFINTFLAGTLVYFICAFLFLSNMYGYFEKQIFSELETESSFLDDFVLNNQLDILSSLHTKNRITLIHSDGTVYFDNTVNAETLENHGTRQEFLEAKISGTSRKSRFSSTMTEKTLYFARLLPDGNVLRISCNQHSVWVLVLGMSQTLLVMLVIAIIISGISASWISRKIVEPLNKIDLENPDKTEVYDEFKPFTKRIAEENYEKNQREELRQQFTANVSHELKTPLTSISGFAEILKSGGTDEKTTVDFASTIYDESQRMITLVNDIIKLSKLDEESISLEKEDVNLRNLSQEIIQILQPEAHKRGITLNLNTYIGAPSQTESAAASAASSAEEIVKSAAASSSASQQVSASEAPSSAFSVKAVQPVIYEMIYNLIDNAIKYNKENGRVDVSLNSMERVKNIILTVKDTGIGFPESEKERIFERFYRIDKSRSKQNGGTGLGLSIVKHAAKYHNASILVSSEPGKGSTFSVIFPL